MRGKALWDELERRAKEKYRLGEDWHLAATNVEDAEVAMVRMRRKGPRGGWLRGSANVVNGAVVWSDLNERTVVTTDGRTP